MPTTTSESRHIPTSTPCHVQRNVGRLLEVRCPDLRQAADAKAIDDAIGRIVQAAGAPLIFCVDWRNIGILSPDTADQLVRLMRAGSGRVLRSATLVDTGRAAFTLQVQRVFKEALGDLRRAFQNSEELIDWLSEVATPEELAQVRRFLDRP